MNIHFHIGTIGLMGDEEMHIEEKKQMPYSFSDLLSDLSIGREIEFSYNGHSCGITNGRARDGRAKWFFDMDGKSTELCAFDDTAQLLNLVGSLRIDEASLSDIFENDNYDPESLYIL